MSAVQVKGLIISDLLYHIRPIIYIRSPMSYQTSILLLYITPPIIFITGIHEVLVLTNREENHPGHFNTSIKCWYTHTTSPKTH